MDLTFTPWLPPAMSAILLIGMATFTRRTWKLTGENPYRLKGDDSPMGFCGRVYKLSTAALALFLVLRNPMPQLNFWGGQIIPLISEPVWWTGVALTSVAITTGLYSQYYMAASWRIGIPDDKPGTLVDTGPFAVSRNPFFTSIVLFNGGIFLMVPSAITLTCWLTTLVSMSIQVRLEEAFLETELGEPYAIYKAKVRRWI